MANVKGRCVVCGAGPTVKSHLFPRALMLAMRGDARSLVQGDRFEDGIRLPQNGDWDDLILCDAHEKQVGLGDDYAVKLLKRAPEAPIIMNGRAVKVNNPHPNLLLHFIYGTVWRHVVSGARRGEPLKLGPYRDELQARLMNSGPYDFQAIVARSGMMLRELGPINMALNPYRVKFMGLTAWRFVLHEFEFYLLTDRRRLPAKWKGYVANDNRDLIAANEHEVDIRGMPSLRPIIDRMAGVGINSTSAS
ncbi:hypothetical protein U1701_04655 [Sphingomonas sp. PB2P19]|uniref:hypothetical protein n=1 Tax=Sphingomonas rhamnosi TaxID=3096156 RepID=UPI002FCC8316